MRCWRNFSESRNFSRIVANEMRCKGSNILKDEEHDRWRHGKTRLIFFDQALVTEISVNK